MTHTPDWLRIGDLPSGPLDAITDVAGVRVGHATIQLDEPVPVRTGVTVIHPLDVDYLEQSVFAGFHRYNGFGEFCGSHWIAETGVLTSPVFLTSTYSVGVVRDFAITDPLHRGQRLRFHHPCIGETNDGFFNGWSGGYVTADHCREALAGATGGPVTQGCVGGGTGMICHGFKGGIGTASRIVTVADEPVTVGVLVQTNHGQRADFRVDGVPVGRYVDERVVPRPRRPEDGSIVVVIACNAPLLPAQCQRLAQRAVVGLGRTGGLGHNSSGDFILAFSTANRLPVLARSTIGGLQMLPNEVLSPLFGAVADAVEAAIVKSLLHAHDTEGRNGAKAWSLPAERLREALARGRAEVAR